MNYEPLRDAHILWEALPDTKRLDYLWRYLVMEQLSGQILDRNGLLRELLLTLTRDGDDLAAMFTSWPLDCVAIMLVLEQPDEVAKFINNSTQKAWLGGGTAGSITGGSPVNWDALLP